MCKIKPGKIPAWRGVVDTEAAISVELLAVDGCWESENQFSSRMQAPRGHLYSSGHSNTKWTQWV